MPYVKISEKIYFLEKPEKLKVHNKNLVVDLTLILNQIIMKKTYTDDFMQSYA